MSVEQVGELYRCNICGNEVRVTKVGGGTLMCCGEDMEIIEVILELFLIFGIAFQILQRNIRNIFSIFAYIILSIVLSFLISSLRGE